MPTFKGGSIPSCESASGIMVGDKTLEEHIDEEEAKEVKEVLESEPVNPYHKGRVRHIPYREPNSVGRVWTRREVNKLTWGKRMMNAKSIDEAVVAILLSGREVTGSEIRDDIMKHVPGASNKKYAQRMNYLMTKTDLGKLVERRSEGKGKAYKLVSAALDCRPEELAYFAYKNVTAREKVLEHHKGLIAYIQTDEPDPKTQPDPPKKDDLGRLTPPGPGLTGILETALSESLGVNVNVSGCIEIKFTFG